MQIEDGQLCIPNSVTDDPKAFEVARLWVAHGAGHVALRVSAWQRPEAWGIVLADLMRHLAKAYEQKAGLNRKVAFEQIRRALLAELHSPTDHSTEPVRH